MKYLIAGGVLIGVVVAVLLILRSGNPLASCSDKEPQPRIVVFGDSLVAGYGATTEGGFVTMLSRELGVPIQNLGRNGDTTERAYARISSVTDISPDVTIVLLGGNDALQKVPEATTEQNLSAIVETLQKSGSEVILIGVIGGFPDPYADMYKRIAEEHDVTYVSNILSGIIGRSEFMSDAVHPNEAGYAKITNRLLPIVEGQCS
jgi:acyl-CoA thioesterase I